MCHGTLFIVKHIKLFEKKKKKTESLQIFLFFQLINDKQQLTLLLFNNLQLQKKKFFNIQIHAFAINKYINLFICHFSQTVLPASANDVYYRDEIGNISTSHLRVLEDSAEVELRPRFPLFGGWKTHYILGYYVPTYEYLYNNGIFLTFSSNNLKT